MLKVLNRGRSRLFAVVTFALVGLFMLSNARPASAFPIFEVAAVIGAVAALVTAVCSCRGGDKG